MTTAAPHSNDSPAVGTSTRRHFVLATGVVAAGLVVGLAFARRNDERSGLAGSSGASGEPFVPNAFLRIAPDDNITVVIGKSEMGQGIYTGLAMIIAEELDVAPQRIQVEFAPVDPAYNSPFLPAQFTGGSTSTNSSYEQLRKAGATARTMLLAAAAQEWGVDVSSLTTSDGVVQSGDGRRRASYGSLATAAANLAAPAEVTLKAPADFRYLGKPQRRLDSPAKVDGSALFSCDIRLPGMLVAVVARAPVVGATVTRFNEQAARATPGVVDVKQVPTGVAVYATNTWAAQRGREALQTEWDLGPHADFSSTRLRAEYRALLANRGVVAKNVGNTAATLAKSTRLIDVEYELPYLAHACMEPLNCVARVDADRCEIWVGTQMQSLERDLVAKLLGLPAEQVTLHTTFLGGGFGRRGNPAGDFVLDGVQVARAMPGRPVKTLWSREDDMRGLWYRPFVMHRVRAAVDERGQPSAWQQSIVSQPVIKSSPFAQFAIKADGIDPSTIEGAADMPYAIANLSVDLNDGNPTIPIQWWRSVGHSHTAFVVESVLDELAALGDQDPLELRRSLLAGKPRHLAVLNAAARMANWGAKRPAARGLGIALHESFGSIAAQVAEVSVTDAQVRVHHVWCAIDCGFAVNPNGVVAQMESGIIYGLSAALAGEITLENGQPVQGNFDTYPILRIGETPKIEVQIVPSDGRMGGAGEPGTPPIAPAVCNAIFAATGQRIRRRPISASLART
ncbi:MAG TPA: xanthine dehydrogenase family protein molybdopterin-binding subunit [Steroidobacteraceae bacterium]|nr:xanthine dehydrogenase family protein molybdopterin-binding subunit [Steroidobacteraceae bacterium]